MTPSFQPSEEARHWATKSFAEPLRPVAKVIGHMLSTSELWPKQICLSRVLPNSRLVHDLEIDPIFDTTDFLMDVEAEFGISIPDEIAQKITTVGELVLAVHKLATPDKTQ